ncbi:hypothetical protein R1sor_009901 [Riccia sorocarpa]|uniref:SET domain-containing protein n=1 Tax=Riccia sorocarpa TaxID=122646 RepID=A0ABD3I0F3_9MARC
MHGLIKIAGRRTTSESKMECSATQLADDSDSETEITRIDYDNEVHSPRYTDDEFDSFASSPRASRIEKSDISTYPVREGDDDELDPDDCSSGNSDDEKVVAKQSSLEGKGLNEKVAGRLEDRDEHRQQHVQKPPRYGRTIRFNCQEPLPVTSKTKYKHEKQPFQFQLSIFARRQDREAPKPPPLAVELELIRREGNNKLKKGDTPGALNRYSTCIREGESALLDPSTSPLCRTLTRKIVKLCYSSRAQLKLAAKMWDDVLIDTEKVLKLDHRHVKALLSRGKALHALQQYKQACTVFSAALSRNHNNIQVAASLHESMKSHHQSVSGEYDISQFLLLGHPPPECTDYVGPVEIRASPQAGRGLFVTKRVEAGTLLLVSNALAIASTPASNTAADLCVKLAGILLNLAKASRRVQHQLHYLTSGKPELESLGVPDMKLFTPSSSWSPDPQKNVDLSFIDVVRKVTFNTFDASRAVTDGLKPEAEDDTCRTISSGLWVLPSFLNHSCVPNTGITFVGRAMFLRASRDLKAGEELTTSYTACSDPNRKKSINKWHFECTCERCQQDHQVEPYMKELREELNEYSSRFASKKSTKAEKLRLLFKSVDMVERVEKAIKSLPMNLDAQRENWVRVSFMVIYTNSLQVARAGRDLKQKIQALQKLAEIEASINGGGVYYTSIRTSAELLRYTQKKGGSDTQELHDVLQQVMKVFRTALGNMGEMFFLELIRCRFSKAKQGELVWLH